MELKAAHYPVYIPDQFLTSQNLNDTTAFLEQADRATRALLIGNGIAAGLTDVQAVGGGSGRITSVQVMPGYGATTDGYFLSAGLMCNSMPLELKFGTTEGSFFLVTIPKTATRCGQKLVAAFLPDDRKFRDESGEVITDAVVEKLTCIELAADLPDARVDKRAWKEVAGLPAATITASALVLLADSTDVKYNNCAQGDCNDKGTDRQLRTRFLALPLSALEAINSTAPQLPMVHTAPPVKLSASTSSTDFFNRLKEAWKRSLETLLPAMEGIATAAAGFISRAPMDAAKATLTGLTAPPTSNLFQYYLHFATDLQQAVNEYTAAHNEYVVAYPQYGGNRLGRVVVAGSLAPGTTADAYRYHWMPAIKNETVGLQRLKKLYARIAFLLVAFTPVNAMAGRISSASPQGIKIIPSKEPSAPLGSKAIPYYYNLAQDNRGSGLSTTWNAPALGSHNELTLHYFTNPPPALIEFNISGYAFFRVEGHLGQNAAKAFAALDGLVRSQDLPLQVLQLQVGKTVWEGVKDKYDKYKLAYAEVLSKIPKQAIPRYSEKFKKLDDLQVALNETSYYNADRVVKLLKDTTAFLGVVTSSQNKVKDVQERAAPAKGGTAPTDRRLIETMAKETALKYAWNAEEAKTIMKEAKVLQANPLVAELIKDYRAVATQASLTLKDLVGLEGQGGAPRGGTFVLITDGTTVVGDGTVPYYVMVDALRQKK